MGSEAVRRWLSQHAPDLELIEAHASTATVREAAATLGIEEARIAKTLAIRAGDEVFLLVTRGDARLDNAKTKSRFGARPRMLSAEATLALTGHAIGGVCPFALATSLPVYIDVSLRPFAEIFPAAGSTTSSVRTSPERLAEIVAARWVDLCRIPESAT